MDRWNYPYHFVDFETIAPPLPYTLDKHPYQMVAFQFSHHILEESRSCHHEPGEDGQAEAFGDDGHQYPIHWNEFLHAVPMECPNAGE